MVARNSPKWEVKSNEMRLRRQRRNKDGVGNEVSMKEMGARDILISRTF